MPAWLAGLPEGASSTKTPSSPSCLTVCGGAIVMPSTGRMTLPNLSIWSTRPLTESTGMAKPTPEDAPLPAQKQMVSCQQDMERSLPLNMIGEELMLDSSFLVASEQEHFLCVPFGKPAIVPCSSFNDSAVSYIPTDSGD